MQPQFRIRLSPMPDCAAPLTSTPRPRPARGPLRPEVWLNARQRSSARLSAHYFRAVDCLTVTGLTLAFAARAAGGRLLEAPLGALLPLAAGAGGILAMLRLMNLYRLGGGERAAAHAVKAVLAALGGCAVAALAMLTIGEDLSRPLVEWAAGCTIAVGLLHLAWASVVGRWRRVGVLSSNIVIVGATGLAETLIARALQRRDLHILGVFDDRLARSPQTIAGVPVLGDAEALLNHRMTPYVDRIVVAIDPSAGARVRDLVRRLETLPHPVTVLVDDENIDALLDRLATTALAELSGPPDPDRAAFNKRMQDVALGLAALIAAAPIMALTALAIRLDSPGPIFFRQKRHGFNQEEIVVWKFRSMRHDAADAAARRQVTADDERVTRVGRFIRATSLDELPQLFNVLSGEMSLVGPRPHAIGMKTGDTESARLVAEYAHRHRIKPGMTGWAAVKGSRGPLHTEADVRRRVQLDVDYVARQSLWLDLWILFVTLPVLLGDRASVR